MSFDFKHHLHWFACEHPERRFDAEVLFHVEDCAGCLIAVDAALRRSGSVADDILFGHRPSLEELNEWVLMLGRLVSEMFLAYRETQRS